MQLRKHLVAAGAALAASACLAGSAAAAFPDYSGCPTSNTLVRGCVDIQNTSGTMTIKGTAVPLGDSLQIKGGVTSADDGNRFVPPAGTTGVFARPVAVPGGLLGIDFPIPGNSVYVVAELAGSPSAVRLDLFNVGVALPLKLRLYNVLLGMNCHIGSNTNPISLNLITGTTSPPAPNRPISGRVGTISPQPDGFQFLGNTNVDNSFSVPASSSCGVGLGFINALVDLKMGLPSAAGNNSLVVNNNVGLRIVP